MQKVVAMFFTLSCFVLVLVSCDFPLGGETTPPESMPGEGDDSKEPALDPSTRDSGGVEETPTYYTFSNENIPFQFHFQHAPVLRIVDYPGIGGGMVLSKTFERQGLNSDAEVYSTAILLQAQTLPYDTIKSGNLSQDYCFETRHAKTQSRFLICECDRNDCGGPWEEGSRRCYFVEYPAAESYLMLCAPLVGDGYPDLEKAINTLEFDF